ncbi:MULTISPECIES: Sec-independent protein translocase protein TatB [unclassified Arsukibacterium]|uniref:Sec-independent protein translocase protein TatB n=1 Tax=unclassified Arsukibacterium TaxID=2635278 RepID=UPI000C42EE1D|nr:MULTISPECIES: Sec-independent protein translocase protein TatB [unclassified Arsukibacterium]MAA94818.1 twin-arginine translocase subunit TatB [Rheinheimera sp.]MBM34725.1 twin-arginine translocase subunit TatB [Rheinheimera sp.]|tara:strand:- start:507 stop:875 length:369 start_codon:yes stop_codon:yes gene_type:complete
MGFWELLVIGVIALLVLGPERLPGAIRSTVKTIRSVKQFGSQMQAELSENLRVHELHQKLKDAESKNLLNLTPDEQAALNELRAAAKSVNPPSAPVAEPAANKSTASEPGADIKSVENKNEN